VLVCRDRKDPMLGPFPVGWGFFISAKLLHSA
jgi:hypothetical protein